ncbi:hypothetical protein [Streptomyces cyaneofuscatus]
MDSPAIGAQVADADGQRFSSTFAEVANGPAMTSDANVPPGEKVLGWIVFEVTKAEDRHRAARPRLRIREPDRTVEGLLTSIFRQAAGRAVTRAGTMPWGPAALHSPGDAPYSRRFPFWLSF